MIKTIVSTQLPVNEMLEIKKQRILPNHKLTGNEKRISVVTGIHGDELEGQYVCFLLASKIKENIENLNGIVDIYPAMNPMGIDSITRGIPGFDLDMNRIFPGNENGSVSEHIASQIIKDVEKSDICFDLHASNIFLREIPQIRISEETAKFLLPLAEKANVDFVWVHPAATVLESTFAHSLNSIGVPTLVVEAGVGMRITKKYGEQTANGILSVMKELGIWSGEVDALKKPVISSNADDVSFLNAEAAGIFLPDAEHGKYVKRCELIGRIVNPLTTETLCRVTAPKDGLLFTIREYPVVDEGSLIARIVGGVC